MHCSIVVLNGIGPYIRDSFCSVGCGTLAVGLQAPVGVMFWNILVHPVKYGQLCSHCSLESGLVHIASGLGVAFSQDIGEVITGGVVNSSPDYSLVSQIISGSHSSTTSARK